MEQYQLKRPEFFKKRKRIGCGPSSGHGKTSCRGQKGQKSRAGSKSRPGFEGGQMPLQRRVPKRGFNNIFKKEFQIVNLSDLEKCSKTEVDATVLMEMGVIKSSVKPVKILGNGTFTKNMQVKADAFSKSAVEKIKSAGGNAVILSE